MAKLSMDGGDDDVVRVPSSSWLGKRRRLSRRFISSGRQAEQAESSRSRSRSRSRSQPVEEGEEDGRGENGDRHSESYRRDEEGLEEQDEERSESPLRGRKVGSFDVTVMDPDVFDCTVCLEPLTSPVFQCENGHIACSSCCKMISNRCPSCSMPIGYNRCCAMEKVLESVQMACRNAKFGCNQKFNYHMKNEHEKTCQFSPCSCPFLSCGYVGSFSKLVKHLSSKHGASPTAFGFNFNTSLLINVKTEVHLLKEEKEDVLFALKNEAIDPGSKIKISCIGPLPKADYSYEIQASYHKSSLELRTCTKGLPDFEYDPNMEPCLLVPEGFFDDFLGLKLKVCIWRSGARD